MKTENSSATLKRPLPFPKAVLFTIHYSLFTVFLLTVLLGCHSTPPLKPLSQLTPTEASGYRVFQSHCAQCHHDRTSDPLHGPGLRGVFQKPYLPSGAPANDDRVTATIQHGRGMMPAQPQLDPQETSDLLAYLHTL